MFTKVLSLTVISLLTLAQDIEIRPKLNPGDKFRLEVARVRRDSSRPQANATGRTLVDVLVVSTNAGGSVLDWAPGDTAFDAAQVSLDPAVAAAAQAAKGMHFRIALNADGEFAGLLNEAEVRPKLQSVVGAIVAELAGRLPSNQRKSFHDLMGQLVTPAALISSATRDAEVYFGLNGAAITVGETVAANLQQPSPIGGSTIPAVFRVRMESATDSSALWTTTTTFDKDALLRMTVDIAQRAGAAVRPEDVAKLPAMQMADDGKYEYDRTLGLMRKVTISRRVAIGTQERLDGWTITLMESPKR